MAKVYTNKLKLQSCERSFESSVRELGSVAMHLSQYLHDYVIPNSPVMDYNAVVTNGEQPNMRSFKAHSQRLLRIRRTSIAHYVQRGPKGMVNTYIFEKRNVEP